MTKHHAEQTRGLLELLNKLPPKPQITFRGYVARRWPHRQALTDRIARHLAAGSEKHTEEHA